MSRENVELVRGLIESWNDTGQPSFHAYHPDAEWDFSGWDFAVRGNFSGLEEIEGVVEGIRESWHSVRVEALEIIDGGDKIVLFGRFFARRRGSDLEVSDAGTCVFEIRDGKVARFNLFRDRTRALEAAGLPAEDTS